MNKLKLEDLAVESFDTTPQAENERGTVFGEQECTCHTCTCPGCPTCYASCQTNCDTCQESCYGSCEWSCDGTCVGQTCWDSCPACGGSFYCV